MIYLPALRYIFFSLVSAIALTSCTDKKKPAGPELAADTVTMTKRTDQLPVVKPGKVKTVLTSEENIPGKVTPDSIVAFARTLIGIPYLYASTDPRQGFDCSGFITYVFNHFNITVPRSSVDFTDYGKDVEIKMAKPGDLILFTGTDSTIRIVGHMGIVESVEQGQLNFIHSTSGKAKGVVITALGNYYLGRFVKVIRVFPDELFK